MSRKTIVSLLLCLMMVLTLAACGQSAEKTSAPPADATAAAATEGAAATAAPQEEAATIDVEYWHTAKGEDIPKTEATLQLFNDSQSAYRVIGTSVPDVQKVITAMSSGEGPDCLTALQENVIPYASQGMIQPISPFIAAENLDYSEFPSNTMVGATLGEDVYGFPTALTVIGLFYNKDLLAKHGYTDADLPKTFEEMYDMGVATTELTDAGEIAVMGFPAVPFKAYYMEGTYAFGGDFRPEGGVGAVNIPETAIRSALDYNMKYRAHFGADVVDRFASEKQAARYTEQDCFIRGEQVFRMDGYWMVTYFDQFGASDLNYGIMPIPGGNGTAAGRTRMECSYYIMSSQVEKEREQGAYEFIKFMAMGDGAIDSLLKGTQVPASKKHALLPELQAKPGMTEFTDLVALNQLVPFPVFERSAEMMTAINECFDYVYNGTMTIDKAIENLRVTTAGMEVTQ